VEFWFHIIIREGKTLDAVITFIDITALDARLYQSGAKFLAGSSATNFGIMPGRGLHHELALLHRIGLSPRLAMTRLRVEAGINALQSSFIYRRKSLNGL
jgi:hypothetical protein